MSESSDKYYFSLIKLSFILILIINFVYHSEKSLRDISLEWFLLAVVLAAALGYELLNISLDSNQVRCLSGAINQRKLVFLGVEVILTILLITFFTESKNGLFLLPMTLLDVVYSLKLHFGFSLCAFVGLLLRPDNLFIYFILCLFVFIVYYQNYMIIWRYRKHLEVLEQEEFQLKDSIHSQDNIYKEELKKSSLTYENKILEEKARLSQALHDKLGHSINGSIYQLEACKVLLDQEPVESKKLVQGVIDNLRTSMDEIRTILRREKPDKKRMALLQLIGLCEECKEKYGIHAEVRIDGESKVVSEQIWEIILNNTYEAVTNALKYANCSEILIDIAILHKVVRCSITDNGIGCKHMKEGMGIQGMLNRTRKINGIIDINSEHGFRINMLLPIEEVKYE